MRIRSILILTSGFLQILGVLRNGILGLFKFSSDLIYVHNIHMAIIILIAG